MVFDPYAEYIKETEPDKRFKSYIWATAIGLQKVDGLKTSKYLEKTARDNIEGKITIEQAQKNIHNYYIQEDNKEEKNLTEEGDKASANIVKVLSERAFSFTPNEYISIHKKIFNGVLQNAGEIRDYNITKQEWVLNGDTVTYGTASDLKETLEYDFTQEKAFSYNNLSTEEIIEHIAEFTSKLWQIHVFEEGNTRTTAVFLIKYLRTLGYDVNNDLFASKARYFRNALVRANYNNVKLEINKTTKYLILFFKNLLMGETNELKSRYLHIDKNVVKYIRELEANKKVDIQDKKVDIQDKKADIHKFTLKTQSNIQKLYKEFGNTTIFGRTDAEKILGLKSARTSKLLKQLLAHNIIEPVKGYGKGKYLFK